MPRKTPSRTSHIGTWGNRVDILKQHSKIPFWFARSSKFVSLRTNLDIFVLSSGHVRVLEPYVLLQRLLVGELFLTRAALQTFFWRWVKSYKETMSGTSWLAEDC